MNAIEKTLEYHELLMTYSDTSIYGSDVLPNGFHYEFFNLAMKKNGQEFILGQVSLCH